jgi:hypothetical protein
METTSGGPQQGKIFAAIAAIMNEIEAVPKSKTSQESGSGGFKYRSIDMVYNVLNPLLSKHKVFTIPKALERIESEYLTKAGAAWKHVAIRMQYTLQHEDGSFIVGEGE